MTPLKQYYSHENERRGRKNARLGPRGKEGRITLNPQRVSRKVKAKILTKRRGRKEQPFRPGNFKLGCLLRSSRCSFFVCCALFSVYFSRRRVKSETLWRMKEWAPISVINSSTQRWVELIRKRQMKTYSFTL